VLQPAPRPPAPLRKQVTSELTSGCCCFKSSQGSVVLKLDAAQDVYCLGKSGRVTFNAMVRG
jgi:hypothetical protein